MRNIEQIPERLREVFERMGLTPEEEQTRWRQTLARQSARTEEDLRYRAWLGEQQLTDERYPTRVAAERLGMEYADLGVIYCDEETVSLIDQSLAVKYNVFPVKLEENRLFLAVADLRSIAPLREAIEKEVVPVLASPQAIRYRIERHYAA